MKTPIALGMVLFAAAACGQLADPPSPGGSPTGQTTPNDQTTPQQTDPNAPPPAAPVLGALPANYGYATIPVRGTATANDSVFVEGGKSAVATDAATDGTFCVDVPLTAGLTQTLKVYVQDDRGVSSQSADVDVKYDPSLATTQVPDQPLVDLAPGTPVASDATPKSGAFADLTDGNAATAVTMPSATIWFDLGKAYDLSSLEILFPASATQGDDTFATTYQVLVSSEDAPTTPPSYQDSTWTLLYDIYPGSGLPYGDGGSDKFDLSTPVSARWVAFYLIENNKTDWFSSENITISEIKINGRSSEALPPQPQIPTCANGKQP